MDAGGLQALLQLLKGKHHELAPDEWWALAGVATALVLFAGLMSGLTLGLMSLDTIDMEVLKRSGSAAEKRWASVILPLIANEHMLLVTLLLCNAAATEGLPLILDRLADPVTAVVLSTSVVLMFGEVLPQAVCSRYGLQVGASSAWFVRLLMVLCAPLAWPIGKLLDWLLGGEHTALFRRAQLKALVGLHAEDEGLGGNLSVDEISVISGALDLTHKTAWTAMTPLDKVFMLPEDRIVDKACLQDILSRGHSRVPVHVAGDRTSVVGLLLAKELVLVDQDEGVAVGALPMRKLPCLSAATPLYDMLKLFEAGGSHMALLYRPASGEAAAPTHTEGGATSLSVGGARAGVVLSGDAAYVIQASGQTSASPGDSAWSPPGGWGVVREGEAAGIITIEDCIEELLGAEIIDETDEWVDNHRSLRVDAGDLTNQLPARLRRVLARGSFTPRIGRLGVQRIWSHSEDSSGQVVGVGSPPVPLNSQQPQRGLSTVAPPWQRQQRQQLDRQEGRQPNPPERPAAWRAADDTPQAGPSSQQQSSKVAGRNLGPAQQSGSPVAIPTRMPARPSGIPQGTPGSWAEGANSGARRLRFAGSVVLKPRLIDPDDQGQ